MADAIAGIVERLTFHWNEFPVIFYAGQGEFRDAVSLPVPHFAVGSGQAQRAVAPSARSNNDFADSTRGVWISLGILRRSEERRVGKECRCRWWASQHK